MDCCIGNKNLKENKEFKELKGGKMDKKIVMWIVIAILAIAVVFVTVKTLGSGTGQVVSTAGQVASSASSGMVGGC